MKKNTDCFKIFSENVTKEDRIIKFGDLAIVEIMLGINISEENEREITEICKVKMISLYKAKKKDLEFEIDRYHILL